MYCILTYILSRIDEADVIAYTDDYESGVVDVEAVGKAIAGADALINAHIAKRYSVPVSPVPDMVRDLAVDAGQNCIRAGCYPGCSRCPSRIRGPCG